MKNKEVIITDGLSFIGSNLAEKYFELDAAEITAYNNLDSNSTGNLFNIEPFREDVEFIGKGHYLVCGDTVLEYQPASDARPRPWGKGNNPQTALNQFMDENDRFVIDNEISDKLLFTCNPGGYLRAIKD